MSPVSQPVFPRGGGASSSCFKMDQSIDSGDDITSSNAVCGDTSTNSMATPKMSSPTRTVQVDQEDFEAWKQARPQATTGTAQTPTAGGASATKAGRFDTPGGESARKMRLVGGTPGTRSSGRKGQLKQVLGPTHCLAIELHVIEKV